MSYGLMCLRCRKYITEQHQDHSCLCVVPIPSFDGKSEVSKNVLPKRYEGSMPR